MTSSSRMLLGGEHQARMDEILEQNCHRCASKPSICVYINQVNKYWFENTSLLLSFSPTPSAPKTDRFSSECECASLVPTDQHQRLSHRNTKIRSKTDYEKPPGYPPVKSKAARHERHTSVCNFCPNRRQHQENRFSANGDLLDVFSGYGQLR
jgi:hypothetical protein